LASSTRLRSPLVCTVRTEEVCMGVLLQVVAVGLVSQRRALAYAELLMVRSVLLVVLAAEVVALAPCSMWVVRRVATCKRRA